MICGIIVIRESVILLSFLIIYGIIVISNGIIIMHYIRVPLYRQSVT